MTNQKKCSYCGSTRHIEQDHVRAKSKGGKTTVDACRKCNRSKGDKSLKDWMDSLKKENPYRYYRVKNNVKGKRNYGAKKIKNIL